MKKYLLCCCMVCMAVSAAGLGCSSHGNPVETDEEFQMPEEEVMGEETALYEKEKDIEELGELVTSEDGVYQVLVPSAWKLCKNKIDESMLFEMQGETEEQYIGILVMDRLTYGELDTEQFVDAYADSGREEYANAVVSEKTVTEVNGHEAYTLRISGSIEGENYTNQLYVVKYDSETVVFTASMNGDSESTVASVFKDVVYSFEHILTQETDLAEADTVS